MRKVNECKWKEGAREISKSEICLRERVRVGESEAGREQGARPVGEWQLAVGERREERVCWLVRDPVRVFVRSVTKQTHGPLLLQRPVKSQKPKI